MDRVHEHEGPTPHGPARVPCADVVDGAQGIGGRSNRQQPGARADGLPRGPPSPVRPVRSDEGHPAQGYAPFAGYRLPRCHVGMMVQLRDDDLVARSPARARAPGRGGRSGWSCSPRTPPRRESAPRKSAREARAASDEGIGLLAGRVGPVGVGVVMGQVVSHGVDDTLGHLCASRTIEVRHLTATKLAGEGREKSPNGLDRWQPALRSSRSWPPPIE